MGMISTVMARTLIFFLSLLFVSAQGSSKLPADISMIVVDLKYNSKQGVKICEVQDGFSSKFNGFHTIYGPELLPENVYHFLENYQLPIWYRGNAFTDFQIGKIFREKSLHRFLKFSSLYADSHFISETKHPLVDKYSIAEYRGILCARFNKEEFKYFRKTHPNFLVFNGATISSRSRKDAMGRYFQKDPVLENLRPKCGIYKKEYSKKLVEKIKKEIPGDFLVIKPVSSSRGIGILILPRKEIDKILKQILDPDSLPEHCPYPAMRYWEGMNQDVFMVEEFISSDPVEVQGKFYDGTMRVIYLLIYDQQEVHMEFLGGYWKLPMKDLGCEGNLSEKHKSKMVSQECCVSVDENILQTVDQQLQKGLPLLYKKMLETAYD